MDDKRYSEHSTDTSTEYEERGRPSPKPGRGRSTWAALAAAAFVAAIIGWMLMHAQDGTVPSAAPPVGSNNTATPAN